MANDWSDREVEAAVADYFSMLEQELAGRSYNKSEHRRSLIEQLDGRSPRSVEAKHQNISAVLIEMGIPYIDGYKPLYNYQRSLLPAAVSDYLNRHQHLFRLFAADSEAPALVPTVEDLLSTWEDPPAPEPERIQQVSERKPSYKIGGVNYLEIEARNQSLGDAGERFVFNFERARLIRAGKHALADQIEHIAITVGPSAGFDIRSYEEDGSDRFIEAKTTKYGKNTPFFLTPNELSFSRLNAQRYYLYRLFSFRASPRLFALHGSIEDLCVLKPSEYVAYPARIASSSH
jgi:hypothetical protein